MKKKIEIEDLNLFEQNFSSNKSNRVKERTVTRCGIVESCIDNQLINSLQNTFSIDNTKGQSVSNQRNTGRCWMFGTLNIIRDNMAKTLNIPTLELSQSYLLFYDKLEKCNFFMEKIIELSSYKIDSRLNCFILDKTIEDGGQFAMLRNLVNKYGVLPLDIMDESNVSKATAQLNSVLHKYLGKVAKELRAAIRKGKTMPQLQKMKEGYMSEIYKILAICVGEPVKQFEFEYKDKDGKFVRLDKITPQQFYNKYCTLDLNDYISLNDIPIDGRKQYQKYTCKYINNTVGGDNTIFFNVPLSELKQTALNALKDGQIIGFACDSRSMLLRNEGFFASDIYNTDELFDIDSKMSKGERLLFRTSGCTHIMTLVGANINSAGEVDRWKVENSWGKENGKDGFYIMSDKYFDDYVYEIFVPKKYVQPATLKKYKESTIIEEEPFSSYWDY